MSPVNPQIPPEFERKSHAGRAEGSDSLADPVTGASGAGTAGPGYGGYGGYGYGGAVAGESELNLVQYLQVLYRRRYISLTVFLVVVLSVALNTFTATRIYEASTRILIERENLNVVSFKEVLEQSTLTDDYYETQYAILQSRGLARRTIDALDLWSHPVFNAPPVFSIRGLIMAPLDMVLEWFEPPRPVEAPEAAETNAQAGIIDGFLGNLSVEPVRYSRLVDVKFRSQDPELAAKMANSFADAYIEQSIEFRSTTTREHPVRGERDFRGHQDVDWG